MRAEWSVCVDYSPADPHACGHETHRARIDEHGRQVWLGLGVPVPSAVFGVAVDPWPNWWRGVHTVRVRPGLL